MLRKTLIGVLSAVLLTLAPPAGEAGNDVSLRAKETLTAVELDHGDRLHFRLESGRDVELTVLDSGAAIVETVTPGGIVYRFWCRCSKTENPAGVTRERPCRRWHRRKRARPWSFAPRDPAREPAPRP